MAAQLAEHPTVKQFREREAGGRERAGAVPNPGCRVASQSLP